LAEHQVYRDYSQIALTIQQRMGILKIQVLMLLYHHPGTRGDDELLRHWHEVDFQHISVYDPETKTFRQKEERTHERIVRSVKGESLGRLRRYVQRDDRLMYHDHDDPGIVLIPHDCCLPSRQVQLRREVEQQESRGIYARKEGW
jgi:hypothetical protein